MLNGRRTTLLRTRKILTRDGQSVVHDFVLRTKVGPSLGGPIKRVTLDCSPISTPGLASKGVMRLTRRCVHRVGVASARCVVIHRRSQRRPRIRVIFGHVSGGKGAVSSEGSVCHGRRMYGGLGTGRKLCFTGNGRRMGRCHLERPSGSGCRVCGTMGSRVKGSEG